MLDRVYTYIFYFLLAAAIMSGSIALLQRVNTGLTGEVITANDERDVHAHEAIANGLALEGNSNSELRILSISARSTDDQHISYSVRVALLPNTTPMHLCSTLLKVTADKEYYYTTATSALKNTVREPHAFHVTYETTSDSVVQNYLQQQDIAVIHFHMPRNTAEHTRIEFTPEVGVSTVTIFPTPQNIGPNLHTVFTSP